MLLLMRQSLQLIVLYQVLGVYKVLQEHIQLVLHLVQQHVLKQLIVLLITLLQQELHRRT